MDMDERTELSLDLLCRCCVGIRWLESRGPSSTTLRLGLGCCAAVPLSLFYVAAAFLLTPKSAQFSTFWVTVRERERERERKATDKMSSAYCLTVVCISVNSYPCESKKTYSLPDCQLFIPDREVF